MSEQDILTTATDAGKGFLTDEEHTIALEEMRRIFAVFKKSLTNFKEDVKQIIFNLPYESKKKLMPKLDMENLHFFQFEQDDQSRCGRISMGNMKLENFRQIDKNAFDSLIMALAQSFVCILCVFPTKENPRVVAMDIIVLYNKSE